MKNIKTLLFLFFLAIIPLSASKAYAADFPNQVDKYVNDYSKTLSKAEIDQLRTDVKAMCDYYSTQIVVCMVPTFGDYDIEEYAHALGKRWGVLDDDGMLILVKPKSASENGEAMVVTSPDLTDVFTAEACQAIVMDNMIPYFKKNDYYGGIEAVLEYLNNMSDDDSETDDDEESLSYADSGDGYDNDRASRGNAGDSLKFLWIALALIGVGVAIYFARRSKKSNQNNNPSGYAPQPNRDDSSRPAPPKSTLVEKDPITNNVQPQARETAQKIEAVTNTTQIESDAPDAVEDDLSEQLELKKQEIAKKKRDLEELKRLERESEELDRQYEDESSSDEESDADDILSQLKDLKSIMGEDMSDLGSEEKMSQLEELTSEAAGGGVLRKVGKVAGKLALAAGGALLAGKAIKTIKNRKGDDSGALDDVFDKVGSLFNKKSKSSKSGRPKLGGGLLSGVKPKLGGGGSKSGKPKLGGNSAKGSW